MSEDQGHSEEELLVCGQCGRVNRVSTEGHRSAAVRCTGCGGVLRGERSRKVAVVCPTCETRLEIDEGWLSEPVRCGACGSGFIARPAEDGLIAGHETEVAADRTDGGRVGVPPPDGSGGGDGRRTGLRRKRRKRRKVQRASLPWGFLLGTTATLALVAAVITLVGKRSGWWLQDKPAAVEEPADEPEVVPAKPVEPERPKLGQGEGRAISQAVAGFLAGGTWEGKLPYCRFQASLPGHITHYAGITPPQAMGLADLRILSDDEIRGRLFLKLEAVGDRDQRRVLVVERLMENRFLVDWDCYVRYATADWGSFLARQPRDPETFQLFVKRDLVGHPSYPLDSYTSYLAYWEHPRDGVALYVPKRGETDLALTRVTAPDWEPSPIEPGDIRRGSAPVTISVAFHEDRSGSGLPPALEVTRLHHVGWVNPAPGDGAGSLAE